MAESNETSENNVFSANDPLDINELASLNEEISSDFIEKLQNQISSDSNLKNDGDLFEEPAIEEAPSVSFNNDIDDNFIKKYKAKLKKKQTPNEQEATEPVKDATSKPEDKQKPATETVPPEEKTNNEAAATTDISDNSGADNVPPATVNNAENIVSENVSEVEQPTGSNEDKDSIESITGGNITEKPLKQENVDYNESLDFLDNNVKYSKYVIYIDPENKDFIDSLTVKERKNLINRIIREQDSIAVTKRRFGKMQTILTHTIVAILTITIAIPCIYWTINASLEATINNYRASQTVFEQLYKEHGKIKTNGR